LLFISDCEERMERFQEKMGTLQKDAKRQLESRCVFAPILG